MNPNSTSPTTYESKLQSISFEQMLGEPVKACISAQAEAAMATRRYLNAVAMRRNEAGDSEAVVVSFRYQRDGHSLELSLPLMTLVPIPYFSIDTIDVEFDALVTECSEEKLHATFAETRPQLQTSSERNASSQYTRQAHLNVRLHASQDHMPAGLSRLLHFLDEVVAIDEPAPITSKADLRLSHEKLTLRQGEEVSIAVLEQTPPEAISWSTSAPDVAVVHQGSVRAVGHGQATIFVETYEGVARCLVEVREAEVLRQIGGLIQGLLVHKLGSKHSSTASHHRPKDPTKNLTANSSLQQGDQPRPKRLLIDRHRPTKLRRQKDLGHSDT